MTRTAPSRNGSICECRRRMRSPCMVCALVFVFFNGVDMSYLELVDVSLSSLVIYSSCCVGCSMHFRVSERHAQVITFFISCSSFVSFRQVISWPLPAATACAASLPPTRSATSARCRAPRRSHPRPLLRHPQLHRLPQSSNYRPTIPNWCAVYSLKDQMK